MMYWCLSRYMRLGVLGGGVQGWLVRQSLKKNHDHTGHPIHRNLVTVQKSQKFLYFPPFLCIRWARKRDLAIAKTLDIKKSTNYGAPKKIFYYLVYQVLKMKPDDMNYT